MVPSRNSITIFTDGACLGNPGPGGWGVVLLSGPHRKELSGGYCLTTNNRMELQAAIRGLEALKKPCDAVLITDSHSFFNFLYHFFAPLFKSPFFILILLYKPHPSYPFYNLLSLCERHRVRFQWVRGHAGNVENERCDRLAREAAQQPDLPPDPGYTP